MKEKKDSAKVMSAELVVTVDGVRRTYSLTSDLFDGMDNDIPSRPVSVRKSVFYRMVWGGKAISRILSRKNGRLYSRFVAGCGKRIDL